MEEGSGQQASAKIRRVRGSERGRKRERENSRRRRTEDEKGREGERPNDSVSEREGSRGELKDDDGKYLVRVSIRPTLLLGERELQKGKRRSVVVSVSERTRPGERKLGTPSAHLFLDLLADLQAVIEVGELGVDDVLTTKRTKEGGVSSRTKNQVLSAKRSEQADLTSLSFAKVINLNLWKCRKFFPSMFPPEVWPRLCKKSNRWSVDGAAGSEGSKKKERETTKASPPQLRDLLLPRNGIRVVDRFSRSPGSSLVVVLFRTSPKTKTKTKGESPSQFERGGGRDREGIGVDLQIDGTRMSAKQGSILSEVKERRREADQQELVERQREGGGNELGLRKDRSEILGEPRRWTRKEESVVRVDEVG